LDALVETLTRKPGAAMFAAPAIKNKVIPERKSVKMATKTKQLKQESSGRIFTWTPTLAKRDDMSP
jgi:hypothetical protein